MIAHAKANDGLAIGFGRAAEASDGSCQPTRNAGSVLSPPMAKPKRTNCCWGANSGRVFGGTHVKYLESGDFKMIAGNEGRHGYRQTPQLSVMRGAMRMLIHIYFATTAGTPPEAKAALAAALANAIASQQVKTIVRNSVGGHLNLGPDGVNQ